MIIYLAGIVPIATAEFSTTFPPEKRGMALGLVGGVYGIANVFGASAGSAILDLFGTENWSYIFYINVPISVFIVISGLLSLENAKNEETSRIDIGGIFVPQFSENALKIATGSGGYLVIILSHCSACGSDYADVLQ